MASDARGDVDEADPWRFMTVDDYAYGVLGDHFDYRSQLHALGALMARERRDAQARQDAIKEKQAGLKENWSWQGEDDLIEHYHWSVYHDAVQSMIAVAALTTFTEALFRRAFGGIKALYEHSPLRDSAHVRWQKLDPDKHWDCTRASTGRGLVTGTIELAEAIGLLRELPSGVPQMLAALFQYRNHVFHNGYEWPPEARDRFERLMAENGWPREWFTRATSGDKLWVLYLSDAFVAHVMAMLPRVIEGIGAYARKCRADHRSPP